MALNFLLKRSGTADKRPDPASMSLGELDLNYDATTGGVFYKDSNGDVVKVGSAQVSATAPNATPAGSAGNSTGEFWYDTANSELKMWDGTAWVSTGGGVATITGTSPITVDDTDPANPVVGVDAASTTGSGVVQLNDTVTSTSTTEAATANAVKTAYDAANSSQTDATQALSDAAAAQATADAAIPCAALLAKGNLIGASGAGTPVALSVGTDGQVLTACAACASGLTWVTSGGGGGSPATPTAAGTLYGCSDAGGKENTSVGFNSLLSVTTGTYNVALGAEALRETTTGSLNTALGGYALCTNLGGARNVATGLNSLRVNTSGNDNTAIGFGSMFCNTTGALNTAVGSRALYFLVSGDCNTLLGACTGSGFGLGSNNVIIGAGVNIPVNNASCQLALGYGLNSYWLTGCSTGAIRPGAGIIDCAGSCGTAGQVLSSNGSNAIEWINGGVTSITAGSGLTGGTITTSGTISLDGTCVVAPSTLTAKGDILAASAASTPTALSVGTDGQFLVADSTCTTGLAWTSDIAPGAITDCTGGTGTAGQVLSSTGTALEWVDAGGGGASATPTVEGTVFGSTGQLSGTTALGLYAAQLAIQNGTLPGNYGMVAIGKCAGFSSGEGRGIFIGDCAGACVAVTNNDNYIAIGTLAGRCATGNGIFIGTCAGQAYKGGGAIFIGTSAGRFADSGLCNIGIGQGAVEDLTTGCRNIAIGSSAFSCQTTVCRSIAIGECAACTQSSGSCSVFIGYEAAKLCGGLGQVVIGYGANSGVTTAHSFAITIGYQAASAQARQVTIGQSINNSYRIYGTWTNASDGRDKTSVTALPVGLDFINSINPVKYTWQHREPVEGKDGTQEIGFIAQELQSAENAAGIAEFANLVEDHDPDHLFINQTHLIPILVKAVQELSSKNDALEARLAALEGS